MECRTVNIWAVGVYHEGVLSVVSRWNITSRYERSCGYSDSLLEKKSFQLLLSYVFNVKKDWLFKELFSVDQFQSTSFRPVIF